MTNARSEAKGLNIKARKAPRERDDPKSETFTDYENRFITDDYISPKSEGLTYGQEQALIGRSPGFASWIL